MRKLLVGAVCVELLTGPVGAADNRSNEDVFRDIVNRLNTRLTAVFKAGGIEALEGDALNCYRTQSGPRWSKRASYWTWASTSSWNTQTTTTTHRERRLPG